MHVLDGRDLAHVRPAAPRLTVGLDLGQRRDWTALAVVERTETGAADPHGYRPVSAAFAVRQLDRVPDQSYEAVVDRVVALLYRVELAGADLVVDETGVGAAVADMFERRRVYPKRVTITGGTEATRGGRSYRVPKRGLATAVAVPLESRRLTIAEGLPLAKTLAGELADFRVKVSLAGPVAVVAGAEWREGAHDELVLAVALAVWYGEIHGNNGYDVR